MGVDDLNKLIESAEMREVKDQRFWPKLPKESDTADKCKAPFKVVYVVFSNCTTINNGACPEWDFCDPMCTQK